MGTFLCMCVFVCVAPMRFVCVWLRVCVCVLVCVLCVCLCVMVCAWL